MSLLLDALKNAALEKQKKDEEAASRAGETAPKKSSQIDNASLAEKKHAEDKPPPPAPLDLETTTPEHHDDEQTAHEDTSKASDDNLACTDSDYLQATKADEDEVLEILVDIDFDESDETAHLEPVEDTPTQKDNEFEEEICEEFLEATPQSLSQTPAPETEERKPQDTTSTLQTPPQSEQQNDNSEDGDREDRVSDNSATAQDTLKTPPPPSAEADTSHSGSINSEDKDVSNPPANGPQSGSEKPAVHFQAILERNKQNNRKRVRRYVSIYAILIVIALALLAGYYFLIIGSANKNFSSGNTTLASAYPPATYDEEYDNAATPTDIDADTTQNLENNLGENAASSSDNTASTSSSTKHTASAAKSTTPKATKPAAKKTTPRKTTAKKPTPNQSTAIIRKGTPKKDLMSETIDDAYEAYTSGDYDLAERKYRDALSLDSFNRDAILGAAAVRMTQQKYRQALDLYQRQLTRNPKDEYAHAGILSIASIEASSPELLSRVNDLLKTYPNAAHLHFLKGRLLAQRFRWAAAQASFFNAWSQQPERADYAYNLAISLDHINQRNEALEFYRRAISGRISTLSQADLAAIDKRIAQLEALP